MKRTLCLIATLFNLGRISKAPGTLGTLATVPLWYVLSMMTPIAYMTAVFVITLIGIFAAQAYEGTVTVHDSKEIVIDEVAGYLITMALVPRSWLFAFIGFALFRFFDILKPWPISYIDKNVKGGVGVMADDIAAGIAASIILQFFLTYFFKVSPLMPS